MPVLNMAQDYLWRVSCFHGNLSVMARDLFTLKTSELSMVGESNVSGNYKFRVLL